MDAENIYFLNCLPFMPYCWLFVFWAFKVAFLIYCPSLKFLGSAVDKRISHHDLLSAVTKRGIGRGFLLQCRELCTVI